MQAITEVTYQVLENATRRTLMTLDLPGQRLGSNSVPKPQHAYEAASSVILLFGLGIAKNGLELKKFFQACFTPFPAVA